jgi:sugar diacid utilization regulator
MATHYHLNTIKHHLAKVKEDTGLDPKNFFDLQKLYAMAKGEDG